MKFRTIQDKMERSFAPSGDRLQPVFKWQIDEQTLKKELVQVGTTDIYERIQACKDDCDIYNILDRHANGDLSALQNRANLAYADVSVMPKNIHEVVKQANQAREHFDSLPTEIRQAFGNDPRQFIESSKNSEEFSKPFIEYFKKYDKDFKNPDDKGGEIK